MDKKRRISLERIGMRGSIILIIIGTILLAVGITVQIVISQYPDNAAVCTATITGFHEVEESEIQSSPTTIVEYVYQGKTYTDVILRQYEASWQKGDTLKIYVSTDDPTMIWTKTMRYRGIMIIFSAVPFLTIGIYKIVQFKRYKKIGENEKDTDKDEEIKYKRSSFIIPLAAGIPFTILGMCLRMMENDSLLAIVVIVMGGSAVIVGIISLINFINLKIRKK